MATSAQDEAVGNEVVVDWRFARLVQAGYQRDQAWELARSKDVDLRLAERLVAQGCPSATAVRILL